MAVDGKEVDAHCDDDDSDYDGHDHIDYVHHPSVNIA